MSSAEITEVDIQAVTEVLRSGRLALGPKVIEFEKKVARYVGVKHAIAVSSGTSALHLIVKALGIGPGDEVLVPSFTFAASVNAILYEGAIPVFVDITADTYNMDPADLERKRTARTRAIMAVDVFGHPIEWDQVEEFALKHQLKIIDDSCEALGAEYDGRKIGSFGDAGAFAFYPNKQITTGEGGMIVTDNDEIAKLCRSFRNQGRDEMGQWLEHVRLGYNYRMDEMSGALGSSQMDRIELILSKRAEVAARYSERFSKVPGVHTPKVRSNVRMSWFVYVLTLDEGLSADQVIRGLLEHGIPSRAYFSPIHDQLYLKGAEWNRHKSDLPVTDAIASRTIALPFHANISVAQIDRVVAAFEKVLLSVRNSRSSVA
ncbi:MAG: DegT/DnrJ/EryC1/StrS family aminotransferase [Methylotenera sp.]|nr:DegT/DnrJ/EryC1/StrS family aminotransferase [Oligoflexia bacterium]